MKIVSLLPNATEIVYALGYGHQLVGRSHECDYPAEIQDLPVCTKPKVMPEGPSKTIDANVQNLVQQGLSVYEVDGEQLRALQPDLIITQMQCELCAASPKDVDAAVSAHLDYQPRVVALSPNYLQDVWEDIHRIGDALGQAALSKALTQQLQGEIDTIAQQATNMPHQPRTALIEWIDPVMYAGNWMPRLVSYAGGINLFTNEGAHSPMSSPSAVLEADPDKIVVIPCGFDMQQTIAEMPTLTNAPEWELLTAVRNNEVYLADGHQYFNRPGPRLVDSVRILAEILHPGTFDFGYYPGGWQQWSALTPASG